MLAKLIFNSQVLQHAIWSYALRTVQSWVDKMDQRRISINGSSKHYQDWGDDGHVDHTLLEERA